MGMDEISLRNYAHLGDAVWELFVREKMVTATQNAKKLHDLTTEKVNAGYQCNLLSTIEENLTEYEKEIVRRGRNLHVPVSRRQNQADYRMATAFETLVGWWYFNDRPRMYEVFELIEKSGNF